MSAGRGHLFTDDSLMDDDQSRLLYARDQSGFGVGNLDSCPPSEPHASDSEETRAAEADSSEDVDSTVASERDMDAMCSTSSAHRSHQAELEELRRLQLKQREGLSITRRPLSTVRYFLLALADQVYSIVAHIARSRLRLGSLLALAFALSLIVGLDFPSATVAHAFLSYMSFCLWWIVLGILSSIGLGTGLQTFLLYLAPHVARFTLKATACGRADIKAAPYDTALWGASDTWSSRACTEFGEPMYPHLPGKHGGYYAVPLLHLVLAVLPEAMLWGAGTAIGELPPFCIARAGDNAPAFLLSRDLLRAMCMHWQELLQSNGELKWGLVTRSG